MSDNGKLANIIEALLFAAAEPVAAKTMCRVIERTGEAEINAAILVLNERYTQQNGAFRVRQVAGGFQLCSLPEYAGYIETLLSRTKTQRLSPAALETLAVIAYRQPTTTPEIEKIRGVESGGVLRTLLERKLACILGRSDKPGRPLLYGTTKEFLYYFGLNKLSDLPRIEELAELMRREEETRQVAIPLVEPDEAATVGEAGAELAQTVHRLVLKRGAEETDADHQPAEQTIPTEKTTPVTPDDESTTSDEADNSEDLPAEQTVEIPAPSDRDERNDRALINAAEEVVTTPVE